MLDSRQISDCYARAEADRFRVPVEMFAHALEASLRKAFAGQVPDRKTVEHYVQRLHLADLALACACASGDEEAWDYFVRTYRRDLYRSAERIDRSGGARELADSLYADLYGVPTGAVRQSLFRYFHGRSSLATWLRSVLAQRHIDLVRERRRVSQLPDGDVLLAPEPLHAHGLERPRFLAMMRTALVHAVSGLPSDDRLRLSCYYARRMTLAQIGLLMGEHEATVSRQLTRARAAIRQAVESELHRLHGLDDRAVAECFESVAADPGPLDMAEFFGSKNLDDDRSKDESCA
jgi:RNA polymerase sigma-70 factor (ECF subfamily)